MARIWTEPVSSDSTCMPDVPEDASTKAAKRVPASLRQRRVMFVHVCSFMFMFRNVEELRACTDYYAKKIHRSGRSSAVANAVRTGDVSRWDCLRWHERLPLYLREEPKRLKVLAALQKALRSAEAGAI